MRYYFHLILLSFFAISCSSLKYIKRNVFDAKTGAKTEIEVPENCDEYSDGLVASIEAMVKYGQQEATFKANLNKINIIEQFSSRIKTITTAQCKINQNAVTIDTRISDQIFFMDLVNNYMEYQKIKDVIDNDTSATQKNNITSALLKIYSSLYNNKKDELLEHLHDLKLKVPTPEGYYIIILVNNEVVSTTSPAGPDKYVTGTIPKKYLLEIPDIETNVEIRTIMSGYSTYTNTYTLSELYKYKL